MAAASPKNFDNAALSPVLLALLRHDARVTTEVLLQGLVCLVDAGWLAFEQQDSATPMVHIVRRAGDGDDLRDHERVLLWWVDQRAGGRPDVPLSAVLDAEGTDAREWRGRYAARLLEEAKAAGLTWRFAGSRVTVAVLAAAVGGSALATWKRTGSITLGLLVGAFVMAIPGFYLAFGLMTSRVTWAGRRLVRQAAGDMESGSTAGSDSVMPKLVPLPHRQAWSSHGGRWHTVGVPAAADPVRVRRALEGGQAEVVGQVVRRWTTSHREGGQYSGERQTSYFCCIDDGVSEEGWTFLVAQPDFDLPTVGDVIAIGIAQRGLRFIRQPGSSVGTRGR